MTQRFSFSLQKTFTTQLTDEAQEEWQKIMVLKQALEKIRVDREKAATLETLRQEEVKFIQGEIQKAGEKIKLDHDNTISRLNLLIEGEVDPNLILWVPLKS